MSKEKCFLCEETTYIKTTEGLLLEIIEGNSLVIDMSTNFYNMPDEKIKINFCPICGKHLLPELDEGYTVTYK